MRKQNRLPEACGPQTEPTATAERAGTVPGMLVMTLEYWPGGDPRRAEHRGWAAAVRVATTTNHAPWLVVTVLAGRRTAHRVQASNAADALVSVLADRAASVLPVAAAADGERPVIARITATVQTAGALGGIRLHAPLPGMVCPGSEGGRLGIRKQLLGLPMLTEPEVQDLFTRERDRPAIVRGLRKAGVIIGLPNRPGHLYPAFQFQGARPHPAAAAVNLLLGADQDPWAAATWWIRPHPELGCRPLDLLARSEELDRLLLAAELTEDNDGPQSPPATALEDSAQ